LQLQQAAAIKHTKLAQLLQPSLAFCFSLHANGVASSPGRYAVIGCKLKQNAATVVQVLQDLFYVLLQLLVVAAIILSFQFYCMFYFTCDRSFM